MPRICLTCSASEDTVPFPKNRRYCKACWSIQQAAYRAGRPGANRLYRERGKPARAAHRAKNAAKIAAQMKAYQETHKAEVAAWRREYERTPARRAARKRWEAAHQATFRIARRAYNAARRAERTQGKMSGSHRNYDPAFDLTYEQWEEILHVFRFCCVYCGIRLTDPTQDHIIPLSKGGGHTASNVVPACQGCNQRKGNGPPLRPVQPLLLTLAPPKPRP